MKKILSILITSIMFFQGYAQYPGRVTYPITFDDIVSGKRFILSKDTTGSSLKDSGRIAFLSKCLYVYSNGAYRKVWCDTSTGIPYNPLSITSHPASLTRTVGTSATFTVAATGGTAPYTYQWQKAGSNISGAVAVSYMISSTGIPDSGNYRVVVSDAASASVTSNYAHLTVNPATLAITTQPIAQTVAEGSPFSFTVAATGGTTPYTYNWYKNGTSLGINSPTISSSSAATDSDADYYARVTDATSAFVNSNTVHLTVTTPLNFTYGYSTTDPFVNSSTAPTISSPTTASLTSGANVVFTLPIAAIDKYWVVRVPIGQPAATAWYHNTDNSGPIPGDVVRTWTVGAFRYYSSVSEFVLTYTDSIQLTH